MNVTKEYKDGIWVYKFSEPINFIKSGKSWQINFALNKINGIKKATVNTKGEWSVFSIVADQENNIRTAVLSMLP